jgi:hypothetical protein
MPVGQATQQHPQHIQNQLHQQPQINQQTPAAQTQAVTFAQAAAAGPTQAPTFAQAVATGQTQRSIQQGGFPNLNPHQNFHQQN